jgi:hypothetical protein
MGCSPGMAAAHHIYTTHSNKFDYGNHVLLGLGKTGALNIPYPVAAGCSKGTH